MAVEICAARRFYLSKEKNIAVDMQEEIPPYVIDGVRFLYKQFIKVKPGVVINDPPDYGQETQVTLFLKAIYKGLDLHLKNVLILCRPDEVSVWEECLAKWLPNFDELVAVGWPKPCSTKSIFVTTTDRLESYCRRDWGIAVVADDSFLEYKLPPFKIHYKIYIYLHDLHVNLQKFSLIHKWIYPDMKLCLDQFRPKNQKINEIVEKRTLFDAFVQNIRTKSVSWKLKKIAYAPSEETIMEHKGTTRKNKDATGTKIKRTKRKVEDDNTNKTKKKVVVINFEDTNSKLDLSYVNNGEDQNLDVETFIREQEPVKLEDLDFIPDDFQEICEKMDATEETTGIDESDDENTNDMKLIYSDNLLNTEDGVYSLETLPDNGLEGEVLEFKENGRNLNTVVETSIEMEKADCDDKSLKAKCELKSDKEALEKAKIKKELDPIDVVKEDVKEIEKVEIKPDDLDSKWEEMALKKFKGSLLDRIF